MAAGGVEAAAVRARCVKTLGRSVACCSPGRRVHSTATMVTEVESMDQFKKELKDAGDKLVVVDFTASWCGPCKMISPYYKDVAQSCGISAMPTFQFYKNGNMVDHFTGASQDKLLQFLRRLK
ncbi:Thioredoxin isoform 4 [Scophthalmus maximus]|uniref:Thioredoxin isoform 4 n=1 Tax=Scophthalmus maximus TaxID=52904 RepID=A0A2U9B0L3_SCOMX|nr:Thioredoxin isoform 4 [Scophthalmus maximus]